jgi:hypothetical protein
MRQSDAIRGYPVTSVVATPTFAPMRGRSHGPHGHLSDNFHPEASWFTPRAANG